MARMVNFFGNKKFESMGRLSLNKLRVHKNLGTMESGNVRAVYTKRKDRTEYTALFANILSIFWKGTFVFVVVPFQKRWPVG
jgi:hypothetical protein